MKTQMHKLILFSLSFLISTSVFALPVCRNLFTQSAAVSAFVNVDAVKQWLLWEQKANFEIFRKSELPIQVNKSIVNVSEVNIHIMDGTPNVLKSLIVNDSGISWFKHPYNTVAKIPYFNDTPTDKIPVFLTASRSLALSLGQNVFTLKMPTDYPHGPKGQYQPGKASTKEDILDGINRMEYVNRVDREIGNDSLLILAKEVAMVADKKTGEGYLFRDLSFMNDGNYYLPALSIPYVGREIAKLNNEDPNQFWQKNYAALLGRAKAKLLLRYGLQMETPNSQNMLIQLDSNLRPTGKIVFRDISDTILIEGVAQGLGEAKVLEKDATLGVENGNSIQPFWSNSAWRFDEAGTNSFSAKILRLWGLEHDQAYLKEIEQTLGINLNHIQYVDNNASLNQLMGSDIVKAKLKNYRAQLIENKNKDKGDGFTYRAAK